MQEGFDRDGTLVDKTAAYAPYQNGIAERGGGAWKQVFEKAFSESSHEQKKKLMNWLIRSIKREAPWPGNMAIHLCSMSLDVK
jgi:phosphoglycolate phosphatase-like HAD superfamily hydrolase